MVEFPVEVECDECGYSWKYNGKHTHPAKTQCPACNSQVEIPEEDTSRRTVG